MEIYFAPMEGMTSPLLRRTHAACFGGCDKYFSPFISTNEAISMNNKELEDVDHEQNKGLTLIPQIISNSSYQSAQYIKLLSEKYGYEEVNINLGCPSGTVVSKGKGSGMLRDLDAMDAYLGGLREELDKLSEEGVKICEITVETIKKLSPPRLIRDGEPQPKLPSGRKTRAKAAPAVKKAE